MACSALRVSSTKVISIFFSCCTQSNRVGFRLELHSFKLLIKILSLNESTVIVWHLDSVRPWGFYLQKDIGERWANINPPSQPEPPGGRVWKEGRNSRCVSINLLNSTNWRKYARWQHVSLKITTVYIAKMFLTCTRWYLGWFKKGIFCKTAIEQAA